MNRTFLLALALVACGDDAPSEDETSPVGEKDAAPARRDATLPASDASDLLDATLEAGPVVTDAEVGEGRVDAAGFDAEAASCAPAGERCDPRACCEGTACVTSSELPYRVCAPLCAEASECESGCCTGLAGSGAAKVCAPQLHCDDDAPSPTAPLTDFHCFDKPKIFASDDTFLGDATASPFATDGVCNFGGPYGKFNLDGALNINSDAYSLTLTTSATIKCEVHDFKPIAYVSRYKGKSAIRVVDPDHLCDVLDHSHL
jgi:hypothetical protein